MLQAVGERSLPNNTAINTQTNSLEITKTHINVMLC